MALRSPPVKRSAEAQKSPYSAVKSPPPKKARMADVGSPEVPKIVTTENVQKSPYSAVKSPPPKKARTNSREIVSVKPELKAPVKLELVSPVKQEPGKASGPPCIVKIEILDTPPRKPIATPPRNIAGGRAFLA